MALSIDALVIVKKEFQEVLRNKYILATMASFPLIFSVAIPLVYFLAIPVNATAAEVAAFRSLVPGGAAMGPRELITAFIVQSSLPFYLLMPSIIPSLISSYSIVGEKKCGTLEPLLATPVETGDILLGKTLAAVIPSVGITWLSFFIYSLLVNSVTYGLFGYALIPDVVWLIAVLVTAPLFAVMSVYLSVVVSSRVSDIRAAQQISAVLVVPIMAAFVMELFGYLTITVGVLLAISIAAALVDLFLIKASVKAFHREEILTKWA